MNVPSLQCMLSFSQIIHSVVSVAIVSATFSERGRWCVSGDVHHGRSTWGGGLISSSTDNNEPDHHRAHTICVLLEKTACRNITQRKESMPPKKDPLKLIIPFICLIILYKFSGQSESKLQRLQRDCVILLIKKWVICVEKPQGSKNILKLKTH